MSSLKYYKPVTPSRRGLILVDKSHLWKGKPEKSLVKGKKSTGGRNSHGRMTAPHRGGGHKRKYRIISFRMSGRAKIIRLEYDPNRTAYISLVEDIDTKKRSYVLSAKSHKVGDILDFNDNINEIKEGNTMKLRSIPVGSLVYNIEMYPNSGGMIARAAGTYAQLRAKLGTYVLLVLPSGETRKILSTCSATIGQVANENHKNRYLSKAGRRRWMGRRPRVRGVAMNPVDHPMGGGEGKSSGGRHPVSRSGQCAKGLKTRNKKKYSSKLIDSRKRR